MKKRNQPGCPCCASTAPVTPCCAGILTTTGGANIIPTLYLSDGLGTVTLTWDGFFKRWEGCGSRSVTGGGERDPATGTCQTATVNFDIGIYYYIKCTQPLPLQGNGFVLGIRYGICGDPITGGSRILKSPDYACASPTWGINGNNTYEPYDSTSPITPTSCSPFSITFTATIPTSGLHKALDQIYGTSPVTWTVTS